MSSLFSIGEDEMDLDDEVRLKSMYRLHVPNHHKYQLKYLY